MSGTGQTAITPCLVARAQAGDIEAMNDLLLQVAPMITRFCRSRLISYAGGQEIADDVVQETMITIFDALPRYVDQGSPFAAWVYAIAARKVADAQRGVHRTATPIAELPETADTDPGPEDRVMTGAAGDLLHALLDHLPERTRKVLLLRAEGMSAEKTGAAVGLSAGTVRVTYHRGMARLRELAAQN